MPSFEDSHNRLCHAECRSDPQQFSGLPVPRERLARVNAEGMTLTAIAVRPKPRRKSLTLSKKQRARILAKSYGSCVYCGFDENFLGAKHEIDHFVPVSRGGTNAHSNLVAACKSCNREKGDMLVEEYRAFLASLENVGSWLFDFENSNYGVSAGLLTREDEERILRRYDYLERLHNEARGLA